jgi:branched-chain amino acid transport system substrate-binding protein
MERNSFAAARWRRGARLLAAAALAAVALSGSAQEPLKIGFSMSLTGPLGGNGRAALLAMQMWAEDVNARGGLLGRQVKLVYYDDQTNPAYLLIPTVSVGWDARQALLT